MTEGRAKNPEQSGADEAFASLSAEELLGLLTELVEDLEHGEHPLEETFSMYRQGLKMVQAVNGKIDRIEKQLQILENNGEE